MANWIKTIEESTFDQQINVEAENRVFALFRVDGIVYAIDGICTHEYALLAYGELEDYKVMCPRHGSKFDIRTGVVTGLPAFKPIATYPVKIEAGWIYLHI